MKYGLFKRLKTVTRATPASPNAKRIFIHAGTYKTGTTYFQHVVFENRQRLAQMGILYPETGLGTDTDHNRYAHRILGLNLATGRKNAFPEIIEQLNARPDIHTALVSYEGFGHPANIEKLLQQRDCFEGVELHGILVFRPHMDYAISLYRELCQHVSLRMPFRKFIAKNRPRTQYWRQALDYEKIVTRWKELVGAENLHIFSYRDIQSDLLHKILKPITITDGLNVPNEIHRNPTLSAPGAELMRRLNGCDFRIGERHLIARELASMEAQLPALQQYTEINQKEASKLEAQFVEDRKFLKKFGLHPKRDLCIASQWKWGNKTGFASMIPDLHEKLGLHLDTTGNHDLAKKVRLVDLSLPPAANNK